MASLEEWSGAASLWAKGYGIQQTAQQHGYEWEGPFLTLDFTTLSARLNTACTHKLISGEDTLKCSKVYLKVMNKLRLSCLIKYRVLPWAFRFNPWITTCLLVGVAFLCVWKWRVSSFGLLCIRIVPKTVCCWDNDRLKSSRCLKKKLENVLRDCGTVFIPYLMEPVAHVRSALLSSALDPGF